MFIGHTTNGMAFCFGMITHRRVICRLNEHNKPSCGHKNGDLTIIHMRFDLQTYGTTVDKLWLVYNWSWGGPTPTLFSFYRDPYCAAFCILRPTCINTCVRSARMHTYMCKCAFIHYILVYIYMYMYIYIYVCMYVRAYTCIHTYIIIMIIFIIIVIILFSLLCTFYMHVIICMYMQARKEQKKRNWAS